MNELALFAGAGGGLLASRLLGWRTVCYVENNTYVVKVLKARIKDGYLDDAPIWDDCFSFDGIPWVGLVDVITAGFPCQPFSSAGKGLSENDSRNGWPPIRRIIGEIRSQFVLLENVPGLISKSYIRRIFGDLAEIGYDAEWGTLSAASVGAPHLRERLWIVAYSTRQQIDIQQFSREKNLESSGYGDTQQMANPKYNQILQNKQYKKAIPISHRNNWWAVEPRLGRVAHGVAHRVDRLTAIGNGQVPEVAKTAWNLLMTRIVQVSNNDLTPTPSLEGKGSERKE